MNLLDCIDCIDCIYCILHLTNYIIMKNLIKNSTRIAFMFIMGFFFVTNSVAFAAVTIPPACSVPGDCSELTPSFQNVLSQDYMRWFDDAEDNYIGFTAPGVLTGDTTWTLPITDGSLGEILSTDGSGNLSWATNSAGGEINTATNVGGFVEWFRDKIGTTLNFRTLQSSDSSIAITQNADDIDLVANVSIPVDSVNTQTGAVVLDSDDISEGTTNLYFTSAEDTKLAGIAAGAEVNVQSDWNAASGDALILNKPTFFDGLFASLTSTPTTLAGYGITNALTSTAISALPVSTFTNDSGYLTTDANTTYTGSGGVTLTGTDFTADLGTAIDSSEITDGTIVAGDLGTIAVSEFTNDAGYVTTAAPVDSVNTQTGAVVLDSDDISEGTTNLYFTSAEDTKLAGIAAGAEVNVQSDWNAASGDALILNKPTFFDGLFASLTSTPTTLAGYGITNALTSTAISALPVSTFTNDSGYLTSITGGSLGELSDLTLTGQAQGDILYNNGTAWVNLAPGTSGQVLQTNGAAANPSWVTSSGGATQLSDLSDVNTSTATNRNVLVADGVDFESRALVEADISDLGTYITSSSTDTLTNKTFDTNGTGNSLSNVDVADLANGTDGELITWNATGVPATVAVGTSGQVLTSNGAGTVPTFQTGGGGSGTLNTLSEADSQVGGADIATLDFGTGFDLTEPLDTKIKVDLDLSELGNVAVTGDWDFGGGGIEVENNATVPGSCTDGQIFVDNDATSGQRLYACESGSFVVQGDGGATHYPPFGSYGVEANTTSTTPDTANVYKKIDGAEFSAGTLSEFTYSSNRLTYTGTESKHFHIVSNYDFTTSNNVVVAVKWYKNGSSIGFPVRSKVGTGSDVASVSVHADAVLATNDYLELWFKNETNTAAVLFEDVYTFVMGMQMTP